MIRPTFPRLIAFSHGLSFERPPQLLRGSSPLRRTCEVPSYNRNKDQTSVRLPERAGARFRFFFCFFLSCESFPTQHSDGAGGRGAELQTISEGKFVCLKSPLSRFCLSSRTHGSLHCLECRPPLPPSSACSMSLVGSSDHSFSSDKLKATAPSPAAFLTSFLGDVAFLMKVFSSDFPSVPVRPE